MARFGRSYIFHTLFRLPKTSIPSGATGNIKAWNGSTFTAKPVKVWNGSTWVTKPLKRWNGSTWVVTNY